MQTIYSEHMFSRFEKELGPCADELGISRSIFQRTDVEFPIEQYYRMLECAAGSTDPHIGLSMGRSLRASDLGAFGHAVEAAPTVRYALQLVERYEAQQRGRRFEWLVFSRTDLIWVADHPPLSLLDTRAIWIPRTYRHDSDGPHGICDWYAL